MEIGNTPAGSMIPPEAYLELMDLPEKDRYMQQVMEMRQSQMQSEQDKNKTEIEKTRIAAESKLQDKQGKEQGNNQPKIQRVTRVEDGVEGRTMMQETTESM
jgi:hypothetical protein